HKEWFGARPADVEGAVEPVPVGRDIADDGDVRAERPKPLDTPVDAHVAEHQGVRPARHPVAKHRPQIEAVLDVEERLHDEGILLRVQAVFLLQRPLGEPHLPVLTAAPAAAPPVAVRVVQVLPPPLPVVRRLHRPPPCPTPCSWSLNNLYSTASANASQL